MFLSIGRYLLILSSFCAFCDYAGKADLSKGYWNPKRKLGVTKHFSEKGTIILKLFKIESNV